MKIAPTVKLKLDYATLDIKVIRLLADGSIQEELHHYQEHAQVIWNLLDRGYQVSRAAPDEVVFELGY